MEKLKLQGMSNGKRMEICMYLDKETNCINLEAEDGSIDLWPAACYPEWRQRCIEAGAVC